MAPLHALLITSLIIMTCLIPSSSSFRLASYNLRYDSMPDNITVQQTLGSLADPLAQPAYLGATGEQPWSTRRIKISQHLLGEGVGLVGEFDGHMLQLCTEGE